MEAAAFGPPPGGAAPTIVMLHEGLGCAALWRDFPKRLAKATGWGAFAYSRAGYGASDPVELPRPLDYMTREARTSLPQVLDGIGVQRGILLGHSDGASIAAIYAGEHNDARVRGLVLIAPHLFTEAPGLASIAEAKRAYETGDLRAKLGKYHTHVDNAFYGWNGAWLDPGFTSWNIEAFVDGWRAPALLIQGEDDQYGTLAQIRAIEARAPTAVETLVLPGCRHSPHIERPEATLQAVASFCARLKEQGEAAG
ncbi:MAG TPA: alpha/beta hydrolase [Roseiarcus sp.]|nr:alpha/beta hydrolase [Roseiarcus sp.]